VVNKERTKPVYWSQSEFPSVLRHHLLRDKMDIRPVKKLCHRFPNVLFRNHYGKRNPEEERLTHIHLETVH